jgi:hypothetical protein
VAEVLPLSDAELNLLASLVRHRVQFMVVGLSAAALQGAPVVTEDVDLWFEDLNDPKLLRALREAGAAYVPPFGWNPPMLAGVGAQPFDVVLRMDGLQSFQEEYARSLVFRIGAVRVRVLPLVRILASKEAANRPKDRLVISVLRDALLSQERVTDNARKKPVKRRPGSKMP